MLWVLWNWSKLIIEGSGEQKSTIINGHGVLETTKEKKRKDLNYQKQ